MKSRTWSLAAIAAFSCVCGPVSAQSWQPLTNHAPTTLGLPLLMTDGTVIVQDPEASDWWKLTPDSSGSYVNGTWTQIASMPSGYGPLYYGSAVLRDGRVVAIGGEYNLGSQNWTNKAAVYDPRANAWTSLAAPSGWANVGDAQSCVLPDGRMFVANPFDTRSAYLDPYTMNWTAFGSGKGDRFDEEGWTLLPDTTILTCDAINSPHAEKFVPWLGQWISAGNTPQSLEDPSSQELGPMVLRPNGTVFAMGATAHNAVYTPPANPLDPGSWAAAPDFPVVGGQQLDMADAPACLLPSGNVLLGASPGVFNRNTYFFEFDGTSFLSVPRTPNSPNNSSYVGNMLVLPTGQVLYTDFSTDVEIYTPIGTPNDAWRPVVTDKPSTVTAGESFVLTGMQLNGLSQCNAYGDDSGNAENYPLVRITNNATGAVQYCRTHHHSTMAVATGAAPVSTEVDVPAGIQTGPSTMQVVVNGISSVAVDVNVTTRKISGTVTLQGLNANAVMGSQVVVQIKQAGTNNILDSQNLALDASGGFSLATTLADGTYDITVKGSHWLRKKVSSVVINGAGASGLTFSLKDGDCNGDNAVTLADFARLRSHFSANRYDANFDRESDLNGDGAITLADFAILQTNFNAQGDN